uniref:Metallo-beta-lactamase domain-containing protein 1 n=1 Tax=Syphacia muris TaxID=451379 RepID=A0A0N5AKG0_9BILA
MNTKNVVRQIVVGFCSSVSDDGSVCLACGSVTLISATNGRQILVDCGSPWHKSEIINGLAANGLSCSSITDVVITHGHSDHCGCLCLFESARFYMDRDYATTAFQYSALQETTALAPGIRIIRTPGHTDHDLSVVVENTQDGTVIIVGKVISAIEYFWFALYKACDLFENEEKDSWMANSRYPKVQAENCAKVLAMANWIIPGHGRKFKGQLQN